MNSIIVSAKIQELNKVISFIEAELEAVECPLKIQMAITIAAEEIFVNIAHYAYESHQGEAKISCYIENDPPKCVLQFEDSGTPYNPLAKADPDITLSAGEREIGGLGIYMVKKSMDNVEYKYEGNKNVFIITKNL